MDDYLLDTNIVADMWRNNDSKRPVWRRIESLLDKAHLHISTITLAELEVGCHLCDKDTIVAKRELAAIIKENGLKLREVTKHTASRYGDLKSRLMRKYDREKVRKGARWPEGWVSPSSGKELQVEEPDIFIAAEAMVYNLVLVTDDKMARLREVISEDELQFDNWLEDSLRPRC